MPDGLEFEYSSEPIVLIATIAVLLASLTLDQTPKARIALHWLFGVLALLSVAEFCNFGDFRGYGHPVHAHEHYHFFLGSKYIRELRYDAIYDAGILAAEEAGTLKDREAERRDPMTFRMTKGRIAADRRSEVRGRFTAERWREFREDARLFGDPGGFIRDHGNTGSPAWAMTAGWFTRTIPLSAPTAILFSLLDMLLLALLFVTVWGTFNGRTAAVAIIVGLSAPVVYKYIGGSILRMDWIVALGISACLFEQRRTRSAGILLGYAVASKLLAGLIVLPLGLRFLVQSVRRRSVDREQLRYISYAFLGAALVVLASAIFWWDAQIWQDYFRRMLVTFNEHYYRNQHSFRDLFLQVYHFPSSAWNPFPEKIAASHPRLSIAPLRGLFLVAQGVLLGGLLLVAVRNSRRYALALGPLAMFLILVSNRYYWQVWVIAAIALMPTYRKNWRHLAYLCLILAWLAAGQIVAHSSLDRLWGGYFGSYGLFLLGTSLLLFEALPWFFERRKTGRAVQ